MGGRFEIRARIIRTFGASTAIRMATAIIHACVGTSYLFGNRLRCTVAVAHKHLFLMGMADKNTISLALILLAIFTVKPAQLVGRRRDFVPG